MKRKTCVVLTMSLFAVLCVGLAFYVKANEKALIRAHIKSIVRAFNFVGVYPVSEYKDGKGTITLTYDKPVFPKEANKAIKSSCCHKAPGYISYNVLHKEGVNKNGKTYNDSFNMTCTLGSKNYQPLAPDMLDENSPIEIFFNGFTLKSFLRDGNVKVKLDDPEKGGMSVFNVPDNVSKMNLKVTIRWNKKGSAVCTFKATPFKDLEKTDPKFQVFQPAAGQMPGKEEQYYSNSDPSLPAISITLGYLDGTSENWKWWNLAYKGSTKEKTSKGVDTESWTAKGKTAYWGL